MSDFQERYARAMGALQESDDYKALDAERAHWWKVYQCAEANGDSEAAAEAWRMAYAAKQRIDAMSDAVRQHVSKAQRQGGDA